MIVSQAVAETRKKAQLARLAKKGTPEYAEMYAKQPAQQRKAAVYKAQRQTARALKLQAQSEAASDAEGAIETFGGNMEVKMKQSSGVTAGAKESK